jgi:hypothetical protein
MGCWMELADASGASGASGRAHVRMHGHNFFVPKTAPGHLARVQATIVKGKGKGGEDDCDEEESASTPHAGDAGGQARSAAKVELDATGVEID